MHLQLWGRSILTTGCPRGWGGVGWGEGWLCEKCLTCPAPLHPNALNQPLEGLENVSAVYRFQSHLYKWKRPAQPKRRRRPTARPSAAAFHAFHGCIVWHSAAAIKSYESLVKKRASIYCCSQESHKRPPSVEPMRWEVRLTENLQKKLPTTDGGHFTDSKPGQQTTALWRMRKKISFMSRCASFGVVNTWVTLKCIVSHHASTEVTTKLWFNLSCVSWKWKILPTVEACIFSFTITLTQTQSL